MFGKVPAPGPTGGAGPPPLAKAPPPGAARMGDGSVPAVTKAQPKMQADGGADKEKRHHKKAAETLE